MITESERKEIAKEISWHKNRYESLRERFNLYKKALLIACDNDKEKMREILSDVGF